MPPGVKICGLTRVADVEWAVVCGADAIGLVLAPSPRQVAKRNVRELLRAAGPGVIKVAVFRFFPPTTCSASPTWDSTRFREGGRKRACRQCPPRWRFFR